MTRGLSVFPLLFCLFLISTSLGAAEKSSSPVVAPGGKALWLAPAEFIEAARHRLQSLSAEEGLRWLLQYEQALAGEPAYDYLLGVAALEAGEPGLALNALERVTLKLPSHAGAWIDLAIAHLRLGDYQSAEALLQHVETRFSPPPPLARNIAAARQQLSSARRNARWHGEIGVQAGRSSNANSGIAVAGLTLTPVGSLPVYLEIDPSRRPKSDLVLHWRALVTHTEQGADGSTDEWLFLLRGKQYGQLHDYETHDAGVGYTHERPLSFSLAQAPLRLALGGGLQHLQLGGSPVIHLATLHATLRQPLATCTLALRGEYERRLYLQAGHADADVVWLGARTYCGNARTVVSAGARAGFDSPDGERPGGATRRGEVSLDFLHTLAPRLTIEGLWYYSQSQDSKGYSPLLDNNRQRDLRRTGWRATLSHELPGSGGGRWALQGSVEQAAERANIALFNMRETQILLGVRYRF